MVTGSYPNIWLIAYDFLLSFRTHVAYLSFNLSYENFAEELLIKISLSSSREDWDKTETIQWSFCSKVIYAINQFDSLCLALLHIAPNFLMTKMYRQACLSFLFLVYAENRTNVRCFIGSLMEFFFVIFRLMFQHIKN